MKLRTRTRPLAAIAVVAILALAGAACSSQVDSTGENASDTSQDTDAEQQAADPFTDLKEAATAVGPQNNAKALASGIVAAAGMSGSVDSQAAQTYATLSTLLQEHVYLSGIAIDVGLDSGLDSERFKLAEAALDKNSVELADLVGSVAGQEKRDQFLSLWRQHIGFFVDYAKAAAGGDEQAKQQALSDLEGYRSQAGAFFEQISGGEIPASAVKESLQGHVETLTQAIDAAAAGDTSVFAELKQAADHVGEQGSAKALASGIAAAAGMSGSVDSQAAQTYATLSTLLEEHVYLSGLSVYAAYKAGLDTPTFEAATATLDKNSVELADVVGSVAGQEKRDQFLSLWRQHIGFFVDYAKAAAAGDEQAKQQAVSDLNGYRSQAGAFFEEISGGEIPASAVEQGLDRHVETLTQAIDSLAATYAQ